MGAFGGGTTTLVEVAELAFDDVSPTAVWAIWQWVSEGVYFSGTPDAVLVHTAEMVAEIEGERAAKAAKEQEWADFLARMEQGEMGEDDGRFLQEVVTLANGQSDRSRVLQALNQNQTPQNAHALLLKVGYWDEFVNPYPLREGATMSMPTAVLPELPDEARRDLTHLPAFAIDDEGNKDPDDALSWEDGRLWVHIADVAALIPPDSPADLEARAQGSEFVFARRHDSHVAASGYGAAWFGFAGDRSPALSFCSGGDRNGRDHSF